MMSAVFEINLKSVDIEADEIAVTGSQRVFSIVNGLVRYLQGGSVEEVRKIRPKHTFQLVFGQSCDFSIAMMLWAYTF